MTPNPLRELARPLASRLAALAALAELAEAEWGASSSTWDVWPMRAAEWRALAEVVRLSVEWEARVNRQMGRDLVYVEDDLADAVQRLAALDAATSQEVAGEAE